MSAVLLQVGVKVLLKNSEDQILILKRSEEKYGKTDGSWDIVGGRIDAGTALLANLEREVREETQLELASEPVLIAAQDILSPERHVVRLTYTARAKGELSLDLSESTTHRWVSFEELAVEDDLDIYVKRLLASGALNSSSWS